MNPKRLPRSLVRRAATDLDLSERRARDVLRAPGCPVSLDDYDADRLRSFALWRASASRARRGYGSKLGAVDALVRLRKAQAEAVEWQVAKMEAELVPVREVAEMLKRWHVGIGAGLERMREQCRSRLPAAGLDALASECRQLLVGLAELRDEWRAQADEVDRRRAERERGG